MSDYDTGLEKNKYTQISIKNTFRMILQRKQLTFSVHPESIASVTLKSEKSTLSPIVKKNTKTNDDNMGATGNNQVI